VSPVSRGRKRKKPQRGHATARSRAVEHAARVGTPPALALLHSLAVVGVTAEQRKAASTAAAALAAKGVAEPPWAAEVGRVRVGECWRLADVYGDRRACWSCSAMGAAAMGWWRW
jgi:hypothetical protein